MSTPAPSAAARRPAYRLVRRSRPALPTLLADDLQAYVSSHVDGPLLVVGGPGTGKTTVLVESVAARIAEGVDPERVLVLTFGRRGSAALRDRIEARIAGDRGRIVHEPLVRTFHAYAYALLRRAAAERGEPSPRLLTGPEQDLLIRELLEVVGDPDAPDEIGWPDALRPALPTRAFAQQLRDLLQRAAERGIGPAELARLGERLGRDDWPAAARFLREYVAVLALRDVTTRGSTAYDPAELVRAASGLLADDPALLTAERDRLAYVYVDELADTDPAQIELLSLVTGGGKPLVAFADPDASIYAFRGADPSVVTTFPTRFRTASGALAETITLHTNYRAAPPLLTATSRVARHMRGPITHRPMHPPAPPAPAPPADRDAAGRPVAPTTPPAGRGVAPATPPAGHGVAPATPPAGHGVAPATPPADHGVAPTTPPAGRGVAPTATSAETGDAHPRLLPGEPGGPLSLPPPAEGGGAHPVSPLAEAGGAGAVSLPAEVAGAGAGAGAGAVSVPVAPGGAGSASPPAESGDAHSPSSPAGGGGLADSAAQPTSLPAGAGDGLVGGAVVRTFRAATAEGAYVAHALREAHLLHGVPWSRMAVLLRSTSLQLPSLQRALAAAGVPTVTHAEDLPLHLQPAVAPFLLLLRCALDPGALNEEAAVALLHSPLGGADPLAERRLRQGLRALALAAGDRRPSGELLVDAVRDPAGLDMVERRWALPAQTVARLIATAREAAAEPGATAEQVLWTVWRDSGLADRWYGLSTRVGPAPDADVARARQWRAEAADRDLDSMVVLFDAAARFVDRLPGARTEVFLDHVLGQDLPADSIAPSADRGEAVRLLTAHAAKGLEWDVVVLAGVQEGIWPDLRLRGSLLGSERLVDVLAGRIATGPAAVVGETSALLDEERRLFYVAATRARRKLIVTAVASAGVGGSEGEEQPSRFLAELSFPISGPSDGPGPGPGPANPPPDPDPWDTGPPDGNPSDPPNPTPPADAEAAEPGTGGGDPAGAGELGDAVTAEPGTGGGDPAGVGELGDAVAVGPGTGGGGAAGVEELGDAVAGGPGTGGGGAAGAGELGDAVMAEPGTGEPGTGGGGAAGVGELGDAVAVRPGTSGGGAAGAGELGDAEAAEAGAGGRGADVAASDSVWNAAVSPRGATAPSLGRDGRAVPLPRGGDGTPASGESAAGETAARETAVSVREAGARVLAQRNRAATGGGSGVGGDATGAEAEEERSEGELPVGRAPRALTLAGLVAELRSVVVGMDQTPSRRRAAAAELARLAAAGVPGAHPDEWWGLRSLSDDRPLVDEGQPVKVTPSSMEGALRCSLRWLLERHGGAAPPGPAQGVGNLVHAAAMLAEDANAEREKLVEYVSARFDAIELAARWLAGPEQERAQGMVDKLLRWLAANPRRLLAIEHEFTVRLADERRPIELTGRVDRLEVDEAGRLVVIDLKTGKTTAVPAAEVEEHAQLAGYQAAVEAGAFGDYGEQSGGAALVQLGPGKDAREQMQLPLADAADPQWAYAMVRRTAETMAAATFSAVANSRCRVCPVRTSCPISGKGRQVVEDTQ